MNESFALKRDELYDEYLGGERVSPQLRVAIREVLEILLYLFLARY